MTLPLTLLQPFNLDTTANYTFNKVTVSSNIDFSSAAEVTLGAVGNIHISGGTANYVLSTDGSGNLSWVAQSGGGTYGDSNVVTLLSSYGSNTITTTGNVTVGNIIGNGQALTGLNGSNVTGTVANATHAVTANTVTTAAQPNITSVGLLTALSVGPNSSINLTGTSGYVKANSLQGTDGVNSLYLAYSGVTGAVGVTSNLTVGIDSAGNIIANGNVTANYFIGNGSSLSSITGGNITGQVANALVAGTVYSNAQPNITSVGTLTELTSNGIVNFTNSSNVTLGAVGNIHISGGSANYVLKTDGAGNLSWTAQTGGGGGTTAVITDDETSNVTYYPVYATADNGDFTVAGVTSAKLQFVPASGQLSVQDLNLLSDATLKENAEVITDPFSVLSRIFGMGFNWKDTGKKSYGVLAQMLEQVLPELVSTNAQGVKTVNYIPIIAFLVEAVKQQQSDIEYLKQKR